MRRLDLNLLCNENMNRLLILIHLENFFVKLLPRGENKKMNLKCVDNLIKQIPKEKKFVANKVVPTAESEDI